jgi:hypothetical protein
MGVHAQLDDLEGHLAADGLRLLGHVDDRHAAFADLLQELVATNDGAGAFRERRLVRPEARAEGRRIEKLAGLLVGQQKRFDLATQLGVIAARVIQIRSPLHPGSAVERFEEDRFDVWCPMVGL